MSITSSIMYGARNGYGIVLRAKECRMLTASGVEKPFLTENDLLTAWWMRLALSNFPPQKPVTIMMAISLRRVLENDLLSPYKPYVSNCIAFINLLMTRNDLDEPLGNLAGQVRRAIKEQGTHCIFELVKGRSVWADFAAACVEPRTTSLLPSFISHAQIPFKCPEGFIIMGKDSFENYWLQGYRVKGEWVHIEKELAAMGK
ncbi:hypothetical protein BX600DRAFT_434837 [Xylariales sp. PMI_506]|nr:hypothetical protein BX600DRAFT_434837 [Xylariales sp. PMI_506]